MSISNRGVVEERVSSTVVFAPLGSVVVAVLELVPSRVSGLTKQLRMRNAIVVRVTTLTRAMRIVAKI
ncbi:hypothetical protein GCM10027027_17410 [Neomicrococcus lactis]